MFCPNCGKQIPDDSRFCVGCGTPVAQTAPAAHPEQAEPQAYAAPAYQQAPPAQPVYQDYQQPDWQQAAQQTPIVAEKKKSRKPLFITLGALVLAAILGVGAWLLFFRGSGKTRNNSIFSPISPLTDAAEGSLNELKSYVKGELPNLAKVIDNMAGFTNTGALHLGFDRSSKYVSEGYNSDSKMNVSVDYDLKNGKIRLNTDLSMLIGTSDGSVELPFTLYLDQDQVQISCDELLDGQTYCIPFENFGKNWNASALAEMTDLTLPENFNLPDLSQENLMKGLNETFGKDWTDFYASIKCEKVADAESRFDGFGKAYHIVWNDELLKKMADQAEREIDSLEKIEEPSDLENVDFDRVMPSLLVYALSEAEDLDRFQYCVNKSDNLIGMYIPDGSSSGTEIRLTGKQNIWERIEADEIWTEYGQEQRDHAVAELTVADGKLTIRTSGTYSDGSPMDEETVVYTDSDGTLAPQDADEDSAMTIRLTPVEDGFCVTQNTEDSDEYYGYSMTSEMKIVLAAVVKDLQAKQNAKNLLKMTQEELESLVASIQEKAEELFGTEDDNYYYDD